ncbi:MAG: hypothetical protein Q9180_001422 [Flavoplaca navasiana]
MEVHYRASLVLLPSYHQLTNHVAAHRRRRHPNVPVMDIDIIPTPTARGPSVPYVPRPSHSGQPSPGGGEEILARSNIGFNAHPDADQTDPDGSDVVSTSFSDSDGNSSDERSSEDLQPSDKPVRQWVAPRGRRKAKAALQASILEGDVIHALPPSIFRHPPYHQMSRDQVAARMKEIHGFDAKEDQVETVFEVGCAQRDRILIAKTGFGKSLLFETVPLLDPPRPGIALVVSPLKSISWQEEAKINALPGARAAVYDGETKNQRLRYEIAAGYYTHGNPELLLSNEFHHDVINSDAFRERLRLLAIDELHCVEDWKTFRVQYSKIRVARCRLPPVPFLGVTATLMPRVEKVVCGAGGFDHDCPVVRTCLDRPEISISVFFAEGRTTKFEDLRRFFPVAYPEEVLITRAVQMPKTVFYFKTIRRAMAFISTVLHIWMPEFGYPQCARSWIHSFYSPMATHDKKRILKEFQQPDSKLRILVATEVFGFGAHVPDIYRIVNEESPDGTHSLSQHLGRTAREIEKGQFFLVAEPYTSTTPLTSKPARRTGGSTITASQRIRETANSDSDASTSRAEGDRRDAARRAKVEPELLEFINAPECHRRTLLKNLGDTTYAGDRELPEVCCSKCNPGLIPPFRPLPSKDTGSAFVDAMTAKLSKWRSDKASEITPSGFPVIHNLVLVDEILHKLAAIDPRELLRGPPSLSDRLLKWRYTEPYEEDIARVCREVIDRPSETVGFIHRANIGRQNRRTQRMSIPNEADLAAESRVDRRNQWLISVGRQDLVPKDKTARKSKKKVNSVRSQHHTPEPSQTMSQQVYFDSSQPQNSQDTTDGLQFLPQIQTPPTTAPLYTSSPTRASSNVYRPPLASIDPNRRTSTAGRPSKRRGV